MNTLILSFYDAIRQLHIFLSISSTIFKCLEHCKVGLCPHVPKNVAKLWTLELFSSPTSRSCVVSTTKVIQQLKTRVVTCSRINCYVFKVYWSAGTQINEPIDWGTITRKWKTILGFSSPSHSPLFMGFWIHKSTNSPVYTFSTLYYAKIMYFYMELLKAINAILLPL